jgi:hypothetical protein
VSDGGAHAAAIVIEHDGDVTAVPTESRGVAPAVVRVYAPLPTTTVRQGISVFDLL